MLHLDQNHSSLSPPHSKSNLILSSSPRPDQHALLSWSPPACDDRPFFQQQHDQQAANPAHSPPDPQAVADSAARTHPGPSSLGPSSPGHAGDTSQTADPPASTSPTDPPSPASSLTPPPDTTSPEFSSTDLPDGEPPAAVAAQGTDGDAESKVESSTEVDKASRASTPLSELSSAPDADDPPDTEKKSGESVSAAVASKDAERAKPVGRNAQASSKSVQDVKPAANGHEDPQTHPPPAMGPSVIAIKTESSSGSRAPSLSISTPEPSQMSGTSSQKLDPKVMTILELNAELLKACMEFQMRSIPLTDPRAQQFSVRLQNNLGWLAAAADAKPNHNSHPLPQMQPPAAVDFLSMDRIQALYTEMPIIFGKELRRRSMSAAGMGTGAANMSNGMLKRERHDDLVGDSASKRQNTGELKSSPSAPSTPQGRSSPAQSISAPVLSSVTPSGSMPPPSLPGPSGTSPSMPPPSMPMGMHTNPNDPQIAAARERARQVQLRQAAIASQQSMSMGDNMRQMSPGSQQGGSNMAGPSSMAHNPQSQMAALSSMGPMAMQIFQALQNPSHQVTQHLNQFVPGFQTLPLQQQMQHFMKVQQVMQARRQQAAQAAQSGSNAMSGMSQGPGPQGMMGGTMSAGPMGLPNGSPTRISPTSQQFPMGNTGGGGMNPTNPMSGLTPAQQANLSNLTAHQKQQLMMMQQQQQMMRGGNVNPNMMNNQMMNPMQQQQQQQRMMQQVPSSSHMGSPMLGGPTDTGNFPPSLRSNPSVPGIARSNRTPSDHGHSPMTPQISQMGGPRGMNQLAPGSMGQMGGNMNASWPQNQQNPQMGQNQPYGLSPPNSAGGFGGLSGNVSSPGNKQQWSPGGQMMFPGGMGNQQMGDAVGLPGSRQTSATPVPQQLSQNSPMGDGTGLNDFDIFNWGQ